MARLERLIARLPETERVDVEAWGDEPTFRVRGKTFVFTDETASGLTVKLDKQEAAAVVAGDPRVQAAGYGLGRHGWVNITLGEKVSEEAWREVEEWVRMSYALVAPRTLARQVVADDSW